MTPPGLIRIATSSYHVGHSTAATIALEKGIFREEGLIPPQVEKPALFAAMKQRGIYIVLRAKASSVIYLNSRGADLAIVGG